MQLSDSTKMVELEGQNYVITYFNLDKSLEIFAWLTKNFGENVISMFMEGGDVGDYLPEVESDANGKLSRKSMNTMSSFVGEIFSKLEPKEYVKYAKAIVSDVMIGSVRIKPDALFRGKTMLLHTLIFEVLKHNYSDFLGEESSEEQL